MEKSYFKEEIYYIDSKKASLSDDLQKDISNLLYQNEAVGIACGYYGENFPIHFLSKITLFDLDYTMDEFIKKSNGDMLKIIHPEDRFTFIQEAEEYPFNTREYRIINKSGDAVWVNECRLDITTADNRKMWVISIRLIDNLRRQGNAIKMITGLYTRVETVNLTDDTYIQNIDNSHGCNIYSAKKASELWHYCADHGCVHPDDIVDYYSFYNIEKLRMHFRSGKEYLQGRFRKREGKGFVWSLVEAFRDPSYTNDNQIIVITIRNIKDSDIATQNDLMQEMSATVKEQASTLHKINYKMQNIVDSANRANIVKNEFLNRLTDDIMSQISLISGMVESMENKEEDNNYYFPKIKFSIRELHSMVEDVMKMRKIIAEMFEMEDESFHLPKLLENISEYLLPLAQEYGISLEINYMDEFPEPYVFGNQLYVQQIFVNICNNAVKYNKLNGSIVCNMDIVDVTEDIATYRFIIKDSGIGMSEEFQKHMFEPFAKESLTSYDDKMCSGLGLHLVKNLVDKIGGTIEIQSKKDLGTTVIIELPFKIDKNPYRLKNNDKKGCNELLDIVGLKVLLVEDNVMVSEIGKYVLEEAGMEVTVAYDGKEALSIFTSSSFDNFDVILMDIVMPDLDGLKAARAIRSLGRIDARTIPIIAFSDNDGNEDIEEARKAGFNSFISKPLTLSGFINSLNECYKDTSLKTGASVNSSRLRMASLTYQAEHDIFTGILNKNAFFKKSEDLINKYVKSINALFVVDLDNFKMVNDIYGHASGDEVILQTANILKEMFRGSDIVGRFGGDEFVVLMANIKEKDIAIKRAADILETFEQKFKQKYIDVPLSCSIGLAFSNSEKNIQKLFENADATLYDAKNQGKHCYCVYEG